MSKQKLYQELIETIIKKRPNKNKLGSIKNKLCHKYKIKQPPTDIQILLHSTPEQARPASNLIPFGIIKSESPNNEMCCPVKNSKIFNEAFNDKNFNFKPTYSRR